MGAVTAVFKHREFQPGVLLLQPFADEHWHEAVLAAPEQQQRRGGAGLAQPLQKGRCRGAPGTQGHANAHGP